VVIAAALGGGVAVATVSNDTVPSFLVSEQAAKEVVKLPTIKPGNDYALTVSIDLSRPSGLPGPKCYTETHCRRLYKPRKNPRYILPHAL